MEWTIFIDMATHELLAKYQLDKIVGSACTVWKYLLKEIRNMINIDVNIIKSSSGIS